MSLPEPAQIARMHQYFAVECNNRAWELVEKSTRSEAEDQELRDTAHAAAYHWAKVGIPANNMRARLLLAEVAAHHGDGGRARSLAEECCEFFGGEEGSEWDRAFATLELAYAQAVCGNVPEAKRLLGDASTRGEQLAEKGDREFFGESHQRISDLIAAL